MSEPAIAPAEPADLHEQSLDLVPDDDPDTPADLPWESDPADLLEQRRAVGVDDERDDEHQL
ncbi:MAG: hypothetical protein U0R76_01775 [Candidatus Nanopelagicales bacterium]